MKTKEFTVLELWKERRFPYIHFLLEHAGRNIFISYRARYNVIPEKVEVYESEPGQTYNVNEYPESFKIQAGKILDRLQKKYRKELPRAEPKKKRPRIKMQAVKRRIVNVENPHNPHT